MSRSVPLAATEALLFNSVAVRDTNPAVSNPVTLLAARQQTLFIASSLDQPGVLSWQYSRDGVTWYTMTTTIAVAANSVTTVAPPGNSLFTGQVRASFACGTAPTAGTLLVSFQRIS